jgi:quercetin dioxygenase-like cupin family protein
MGNALSAAEHAAQRERRTALMRRVRTLSRLLLEEAVTPPDQHSLRIADVVLTPVRCEGDSMIVRWTYDPEQAQSAEFPEHKHEAMVEVLTLVTAGIVDVRGAGFTKTLQHPGDVVYIPAGEPHSLYFRPRSGQLIRGWGLMIPPDPGLLAVSSLRGCQLHQGGRCRREAWCLHRQLTGRADGLPDAFREG